jgi:hypothetical protein
MAPLEKPLIKVTKVSAGGGNKMGLIKPKRTTKSQMMNNTTGPAKGKKLRANEGLGGALLAPPCGGVHAAGVVML